MSAPDPSLDVHDRGSGDRKPDDRRPGEPTRPWSPLATAGLSMLIFIVFSVVQALVGFVLPALGQPDPAGAFDDGTAPQWNGWTLSLSILAAVPIAVALTLAFARKRGGIGRTLALRDVSAVSLIGWILAVIAYIVLSDWVTQSLELPVVPDFMLEAYRTAGFLPLFWFALIVLAPVFEETLFRGFLFDGLERSPLGGIGAVLVTAAAWTALHVQYEIFHLMIVFGAGTLLGLARLRSGSLYAPLAMHGAWNLIATAQVASGMGT